MIRTDQQGALQRKEEWSGMHTVVVSKSEDVPVASIDFLKDVHGYELLSEQTKHTGVHGHVLLGIPQEQYDKMEKAHHDANALTGQRVLGAAPADDGKAKTARSTISASTVSEVASKAAANDIKESQDS